MTYLRPPTERHPETSGAPGAAAGPGPAGERVGRPAAGRCAGARAGATSSRRRRDLRLDLLRGFCAFAMVVDHLGGGSHPSTR